MKTKFKLDSPKADLLPATIEIYSDEENGYPPRLHIQLPPKIGYVELYLADLKELLKSLNEILAIDASAEKK